jgi:hypothetical protein
MSLDEIFKYALPSITTSASVFPEYFAGPSLGLELLISASLMMLI